MNIILLRKVIAETLGTAFLVMIVIGSGIMGQNLSADTLSILLANTIATGVGLTTLIWVFIAISGAHFNPAVTLVMFLRREMSAFDALGYITAQFLGAMLGVIVVHAMFDLTLLQSSSNFRGGVNFYLSEGIATFGLLMTILSVRQLSLLAVAPAVGLYIAAGYWFTSSTSFANPAVTVARGFTDSFTGIDPAFILPFIGAQLIAAVVAMLLMGFLLDD
ncbi:MAG: aquaporin family protein [Pseudomonadales bacterium]|nr:aquaporin family protein [Pseudomonadales bacterium]